MQQGKQMENYGVIFDMDGVLVDSYQPHYESWKISCEELGFPINDEKYALLFGQTFDSFVKALATRPMSEEEIKKWYWDKEALYRRIIADAFPENPGASSLLNALNDKGFKLAIGSSGPKENVECVVENLPAGRLFHATVNGDECANGKPDPEVFIKSAEKMGLPAKACLVIEDSIHGLQAAKSAGMAAIGITGTAPAEQLAEYADMVVDSLEELNPEKIASLIENHH